MLAEVAIRQDQRRGGILTTLDDPGTGPVGRADGTKQWGYQGYALYTSAEEPSGVISGHDIYKLNITHRTGELAAANFGLGLYWRVMSL